MVAAADQRDASQASDSLPDSPSDVMPQAGTHRISGSAEGCAAEGCVSKKERLVAASQPGAMSLEKLGYSWDQTEQEVRIYLSVAADDVSCEFTSRSCALTAWIGQQQQQQEEAEEEEMGDGCERRQQQQQQRQRYVFSIMRTFAPIDPETSLARVPRSRRHVALKLRKREVGVEWPCLRCVDESINVMDRSTR